MKVARPTVAVEGRWAGRPLLSAAVLAVAHLVPISAAVATSALLSRRMHAPAGRGGMVAQWALLFGASTVALLVVDRVAKRLLPLAALLKLSMVFPDVAPRRLRVARRSGSVRNLQARLDEAKALGADDEPTRAAEVILALVGALHAHDKHTRGHSERVRWFTDLIAEELKLPVADRDRLRWASLLHDIGKLQVSPKILNKPARLQRREWRHIHRHPEAGARLAAPLAPWLGEWALTIAQHHEKFDGSGYPHRLRGDEICLGARIVAVADAFEVMTAVRPYKKAMTPAAARRELTRSAGTHFDPAVVRAFLRISIGRLRWVSGPVAWVAQIPFVGWVPRLAEGAAAVTGPAAGVVGTAAGAAALTTGATFLTDAQPLVVDPPAAEGGGETVPADDVAGRGDDPSAPTTTVVRVLGATVERSPLPTGSPVVEAPTVDATTAALDEAGNKGNGVGATPASGDTGTRTVGKDSAATIPEPRATTSAEAPRGPDADAVVESDTTVDTRVAPGHLKK